MRCVHCGKEIRDGVIFCIYCDRPAKREYAHYACEFYDLSITDRFSNVLARISNLGSSKNTNDFRKYSHHNNKVDFTTKAKEKLTLAKKSYTNYLQSISSMDTHSGSTQGEDYIKLNDVVDTGKKLMKFLSQ